MLRTRRGSGTSQLLRRSPVREILEMKDRFDRLLETLPWAGSESDTGGLVGWSPKTDITETDDAYVIRAEVPGVRREDLTVSVDDQHLIVRGDRRGENGGGRFRRRLSRSCFYRAFHVPPDVERNAVTAELDEGLLTIRLPRSSLRQDARRIEVRSP